MKMWNFIKEMAVEVYWEIETKTGGRAGEILGILFWVVVGIILFICGAVI